MSIMSVAVRNAYRASAITLCSAVLFSVGCASGPDSAQVVKDTVHAWSTDNYVPPTDPAGASKNAARVLATTERTTDRVMQTGSAGALIHEKPSATSKAIGRLDAFDAVRVTSEADFIRVAPADAPDDVKRQAGNMKEYAGKSADVSPTWVRVKAGSVEGWVSARSLSDPLELATSSESMAQARSAKAAGTANKGFSEKMKLKSTAMKGAAGTPQLKGANYTVAGQIADRIDTPMVLAASADPFAPGTRASAVPAVGQPLATVDSQLAVKAAEVQMAAMNPPGLAGQTKAVSDALALVGKSDTANTTTQLAQVLDECKALIVSQPITPVEERALGYDCLAMCIGDSKVLPDSSPVAAYVRSIGSRVAVPSSMPYPAMGLEFIVIDDAETPNAMAVPGGPIVITTGMLRFLDSEDELAVILAHEIGHIEERHGLKQAADMGLDKWSSIMSLIALAANGKLEEELNRRLASVDVPAGIKAQGIEQFKGWLFSQRDELWTKANEAVMKNIINASGPASQGIETAADLRGMSLAAAAGYNPVALEAILERINTLTGSYGGANYSNERLAQARQVLAKLPTPDGGTYVSISEGGTVTPSSQAAANWKRLDEQLGK